MSTNSSPFVFTSHNCPLLLIFFPYLVSCHDLLSPFLLLSSYIYILFHSPHLSFLLSLFLSAIPLLSSPLPLSLFCLCAVPSLSLPAIPSLPLCYTSSISLFSSLLSSPLLFYQISVYQHRVQCLQV